MRALSVVTSLVLLILRTPGQTPITVDELGQLLDAGVDAAHLREALGRLGPPNIVTEDDLSLLERKGADASLREELARRLVSLRRLERLAEHYDVRHDEGGVRFLLPKGWVAARSNEAETLLITLRPRRMGAEQWFFPPTVFLCILRSTGLPEEAEPELAQRIAQLVWTRLERSKMRPSPLKSGLGMLGDRAAPEHVVAASEPASDFPGDLLLRTRVYASGSIVTLGYACAPGDRPEVASVFEDLSSALDVR